MHVEMSLEENETSEVAPTDDVKPVDTQTISGSQVAAAFARMENEKKNNNKSRNVPTLIVSMAAVMVLVALYFVLVLVL